MKRMFAALLLASAAVLSTVPAIAQDATQPAPTAQDNAALDKVLRAELPPARMALALKLVKLSGTARIFDTLLPDIADQAKNDFIRANPQMQLGIINVVDKIAVELVSRRPELDHYLARVWASGFTDKEMQQLVDFYSTDTGKKLAATLPQILAVQTAAAQQWGSSIRAELNQKVKEQLAAAMAAEQQALQNDTAGPAAPTAPAPSAAPQQ